MKTRTNLIYIGTANRLKKCEDDELLTEGVVLRFERILAGVESTIAKPKTKNVSMKAMAVREANILKEIFEGNDKGYGYIVIPFTLADKIDCPHGRTKRHRDIARMVKCVLLDIPSETQDQGFDDETEQERIQMRRIQKAKDDNRQRKANERHEKRMDELSEESRKAFDAIWKRHPSANKGQEKLAVTAFANALRKGVTIDAIESGHLKWCNSVNWKKDGGRYVQQLHKWLDGEMWNAEPPDFRTEQEKDDDMCISACVQAKPNNNIPPKSPEGDCGASCSDDFNSLAQLIEETHPHKCNPAKLRRALQSVLKKHSADEVRKGYEAWYEVWKADDFRWTPGKVWEWLLDYRFLEEPRRYDDTPKDDLPPVCITSYTPDPI